MNKRFGQNNRSSVSNSENTSPVPFDEQATGPDGASGRPNVEAAVASGRERRKQGDIDEALNSVLYELDKKEKSKRQHSSKVDATALFQNNLDDPETPTVLNISPVGATEAKLGAFGRNDDKKKGSNCLSFWGFFQLETVNVSNYTRIVYSMIYELSVGWRGFYPNEVLISSFKILQSLKTQYNESFRNNC